MTSDTLTVSEAFAHDIGEVFDLSDLFLCDDFSSEADQGEYLWVESDLS